MKFILSASLVLACLASMAQINPVDRLGIAIGGYDPVAYFQKNQALKGTTAIKVIHDGVTYHFSSLENQQLFIKNPEGYKPQYEGYCALAVSYGKKISIDPETFKVKDGKLYLFFHGKTGNGKVNSLETWNKNEERLLKKAEANWPNVKKVKYKPEETL